MNELSINGEWPNLENKTIQELIAQEFWCDGKRKDQANVLYIKAAGKWFRLYFDYSIVFWRQGNNGLLEESADRGQDFGYPLIDWGKELSIIGDKINSCEATLVTDGVQVEFIFSKGKSLTVQSIKDETSIKT